MGTKAEMQGYSDTNVAVGGYDYHYRDRYVITKTGVLTDGDIIAIDNRLIESNTNIKDEYKEYEEKKCPPYSGDLGDSDYFKKWQNSVEIKGKSSDEIKNLLEECKTLKNNLSVLISSAEDDLKDVKDKGYDVNREAAKNLQNSINTIKNIDSSIVVDGSNYNEGIDQYGCNVVPAVVKKWIKVALNFVKYVALVLVIVLGTIDFIKAAASGEPDAMKKAGQSFIKRVVAVIILFLLPMIVDLLLNLIDLFGAKTDCFGVLE